MDSLLKLRDREIFRRRDPRGRPLRPARWRGYEAAAIKTSLTLAFLNFGQALIITTGLVLVMVMAAMGVQRGELTVGDFVMVNAFMIQITMPLNFLGTVYREIRQSLVDMGEMFDLLEQPQEVADKPGAPALKVGGAEVVFEDVRFAYDPARPILKGLSFRVAPGETVALVGPSGSGKSTIGRLLFRFYDVTGGAIRIDGQDLRDITQDSLHDAIGVVPAGHRPLQRHDPLQHRLRPRRSDRGGDRGRRQGPRASTTSSSACPKATTPRWASGGLKLSGGEKQRVGIARTLLKDPPILLLDEATSALDTETERDIQSELKMMGQGRSVITIAHRLSTVVEADQIIVLQAGEIAERGTHDALLAQGGRYASMWARQMAGEEEN